jgi:tRNA(Ile)-lysidine synthase
VPGHAATAGPARLDPVRALLPRTTLPPPGTVVTCAVSGGADSLALLALAVAAGCRVTAAHVDHGLRPGSAAEAELVRRTAHDLGAGFVSLTARVTPGPNLEARARTARYAALPPDVLTGHTADDQAETVLLNLMRGAGLDGLAGMAPARHPLLRLRRHETRQACAELGLIPLSDPSNDDPAFRRNRVRHELVPLLDSIAGRDVSAILARQAELLREEAALLDELAAALDPTDAAGLTAAPRALARRAVRAWLGRGQAHPVDAGSVERVLDVARGDVRAAEVGGGRRVARTAGVLRVEDAPGAATVTADGG